MSPFKRAFLIFVFGLGTVGGFAHGFASLGHCASSHREARRLEFEDRVADVCLRAAERHEREAAYGRPPYPPPSYHPNAAWAPAPVAVTAPPSVPAVAPAPALAAPAAAPVLEAAPAATE